MNSKLTFKTLPKSYSEMLKMHVLRPIHDKVDYEDAIEIIDTMAGHRLNSQQADYLEALSTLVEAYERQHVPQPKMSGIALVHHLLEANDMSAADLARLLGVDRSLGVRILNGERSLTVQHIKTLAARFGLPSQLFLS